MIGIASPTFCSTPFLEMLEEISPQFKLWEILAEGEDMLDLIAKDISYAKDSLGMSFQVHAAMSDVNIGSVYEPMRQAAVDEVKNTILMCRRLDIPLMTLHPGFVQGIAFLDRARAFEMTKRSIREIDPVAKEHSIVVALENMPTNINATCTTASELLDAIDGTEIGVCFDMGHANTANQLDEMLKALPRFKNVHLHNNEGEWDQHNRIDDGTADLNRVVSALRGSYTGNIVIESTDLESGVESRKILEKLLG